MRWKILLAVLFCIHIFLMFYNLEKWAPFGWDQVDSAWAALKIITLHKYPLLGMIAKANSGIYIGPLYYYLAAVFYFFTGLDPIASPILAGFTSLFSFWIIYYVAKNIFNRPVALMSLFIYVFSSYIITIERVQGQINFIAPLSILIFYYLYKILTGKIAYFIHLAVAVGLSFHIHFTSIFFPIIILLSLPFVPWSKKTVLYAVCAAGIFILFLLPHVIYYTGEKNTAKLFQYSGYIQTYYHGFHLVRVFQLAHDAFIRFESILGPSYPWLRNAVFMYIPVFYFAYTRSQHAKHRIKLFYLIALWIAVPWITFSTYNGEISDYYFNAHLYLAVLLFAYISVWIWSGKNILFRAGITAFWLYYSVINIIVYTHTNNTELTRNRQSAIQAVSESRRIEFCEGDPRSYLYYFYMYKSNKFLPYKL